MKKDGTVFLYKVLTDHGNYLLVVLACYSVHDLFFWANLPAVGAWPAVPLPENFHFRGRPESAMIISMHIIIVVTLLAGPPSYFENISIKRRR